MLGDKPPAIIQALNNVDLTKEAAVGGVEKHQILNFKILSLTILH